MACLKWSTRHNGRRAHRVFADSQTTKDDLIRFDGIAADKISVVYPGVDPDLQRVEGEMVTAVCQKYQIMPPYLLYISTIHPRKNLERLVRAYAQSDLPHQLVLAGKKGWLAQPILDTISNLQAPLSEKIILPGFIADEDKAALISRATAVLYPSLYEGFGFPILEAQACGVPVLAANTSSCPEVAGDAALLVDPSDVNAISDGMRQLAQDNTLRQILVTKGYANVSRFSWEKTAEQILKGLVEMGEEGGLEIRD
ncbi:MAG: glycosyltransferase family 4 protein [Ardenticatenaceae bacterium]|nr:glycosyltransferase family 4 protein [Ardenticatenaceae bacterium]